ncbi:hypothetical protein [Pontiella sp.]|uniref:hypothetical protein n=1 Tax=Pontiella sp. TaxID=2837462 RepID=UPI00356563D2
MKRMDRTEVLKNIARGGVLAGIVGYGVVLVSRTEKVECSSRCGACAKLQNGTCSLGLK